MNQQMREIMKNWDGSNEVSKALELAKTAELDGSHRSGQPLTDKTGGAARVGAKPSEQDKMGVEGTGNTGAANVSTEGDDALVDALESVCADCGANSAKTGLDLDTDVKLNGKDVKKSCGKCAKCGGDMVAKEDDADDVEKTIAAFVGGKVVAKAVRPVQPQGLLGRMAVIVSKGGQV